MVFTFICRLALYDQSLVLARGGIESLDFCRRFGLPETTAELRPANWNDDGINVTVSEGLARISGHFATNGTSLLVIPCELLNSGELTIGKMHAAGTIHFSPEISPDRWQEIVRETLLYYALNPEA